MVERPGRAAPAALGRQELPARSSHCEVTGADGTATSSTDASVLHVLPTAVAMRAPVSSPHPPARGLHDLLRQWPDEGHHRGRRVNFAGGTIMPVLVGLGIATLAGLLGLVLTIVGSSGLVRSGPGAHGVCAGRRLVASRPPVARPMAASQPWADPPPPGQAYGGQPTYGQAPPPPNQGMPRRRPRRTTRRRRADPLTRAGRPSRAVQTRGVWRDLRSAGRGAAGLSADPDPCGPGERSADRRVRPRPCPSRAGILGGGAATFDRMSRLMAISVPLATLAFFILGFTTGDGGGRGSSSDSADSARLRAGRAPERLTRLGRAVMALGADDGSSAGRSAGVRSQRTSASSSLSSRSTSRPEPAEILRLGDVGDPSSIVLTSRTRGRVTGGSQRRSTMSSRSAD